MRINILLTALILFSSLNIFAQDSEVHDVNISKLPESSCIRTSWAEYNVYVCRYSQGQITNLETTEHSKLGDPEGKELIQSMSGFAKFGSSEKASSVFAIQQLLEKKPTRSIKENIFVAILISPIDGCAPLYRPEIAPEDLGESWSGGFFNPCSGDSYDLAGRILNGHRFKNNWNLRIPPHRYISDEVIRIGELPDRVKINHYDFSPNLYSPYLYEEQRLFLASIWDKNKIVTEVLKRGVNPNKIKLGSYYPLHMAVISKNIAVIKTLLENGANPTLKGKNNLTPISLAKQLKFKEILVLLNKYEKKF